MLYIRVDANEIVAMGHVMRCLSIAEAAKTNGIKTTFILADTNAEQMIIDKGFDVVCLDSKWSDLDSEIEKMIDLIKKENIEALLIDSYYVTENYLKELKKHTKIIYIDDIDKFIYPVDVLVNYSFYGKSLNYEGRYKEKGYDTRFLLGPRYVPLRKEFEDVEKKINEKISSVLITSGGADSNNVIGKLLDKFCEKHNFKDTDYYVVMGAYNVNKQLLQKKWEEYKNVHLLENVSNMAYYMQKCDIAVSAAGSTLYELCACGIPSVIYTMADNQTRNAIVSSDLGLLLYAGDTRKNETECIDKIIEGVKDLTDGYEKRKEISAHMQKQIKGNGCAQLLKELFWRG